MGSQGTDAENAETEKQCEGVGILRNDRLRLIDQLLLCSHPGCFSVKKASSWQAGRGAL